MNVSIKTSFIDILLLIFLCTLLNYTLVFAWGDNSADEKGRPSYTQEDISGGVLEDQIIFNTISDGVIGNEKNFVAARKAGENKGADNIWNANDITVEDGEKYLIRIYVHNNNPNGKNAIAENTKVAFSIPGEYDSLNKRIQVNGFIDSSNAVPSEYWDYVNFNSDIPFHLEYIYNSAFIENNGIGRGGLILSDDIVKAKSGGTIIGYDALDGRMPGGFKYASYIGIEVKAVFNTDYAIEQKVRLEGTKEWTADEITAKVGDKVEFQMQYLNTDLNGLTHNNVMVRNILPASLKYVPGSTILFDSLSPSGAPVLEDTLVTEKGINIGNYKAGENAYVCFTAEVVEDGLACGSNVLVDWAATTVGSYVIQDSARVRVENGKMLHILTIVVCILGLLLVIVLAWIKILEKNNSEKKIP